MSTRRWLFQVLLVFVLLGLFSGFGSAQASTSEAGAADAPVTGLVQWQNDGVALVTAFGNQRWPQIVTDGAGGAIVVWQDSRPYYTPDAPRYLYAQRISPDGQPLWQPDGIQVAPLGYWNPQIVSDGQGGAIVAWYEERNNAVNAYVQRIAPDGSFVWGTNGLALATREPQGTPRLAGDGAGGAFVTWFDYNENEVPPLLAQVQHVLADGSFAWAAGGVSVAGSSERLVAHQIVADETGGVIVAWQGDGQGRIGIQRVRNDGTRAWVYNGIVISIAASVNSEFQLLADHAGGATVVWVDERHLNDDIYAQRVAADGTAQWASGGTPVIVADGDQRLPRMIGADQDSVIVAWHDTRPVLPNVLLQRIGADGRVLWAPSGVPVGYQRMQAGYDGDRHYDLASDGTGGVMVTWQGAAVSPPSVNGIWLQRLSPDGAPLWPGGGTVEQIGPNWYILGTPRLLTLATADVIVVWEDNRRWYKGDEYDIYAQRVTEGSYRNYLSWFAR
jgi:hypothetical protein